MAARGYAYSLNLNITRSNWCKATPALPLLFWFPAGGIYLPLLGNVPLRDRRAWRRAGNPPLPPAEEEEGGSAGSGGSCAATYLPCATFIHLSLHLSSLLFMPLTPPYLLLPPWRIITGCLPPGSILHACLCLPPVPASACPSFCHSSPASRTTKTWAGGTRSTCPAAFSTRAAAATHPATTPSHLTFTLASLPLPTRPSTCCHPATHLPPCLACLPPSHAEVSRAHTPHPALSVAHSLFIFKQFAGLMTLLPYALPDIQHYSPLFHSCGTPLALGGQTNSVFAQTTTPALTRSACLPLPHHLYQARHELCQRHGALHARQNHALRHFTCAPALPASCCTHFFFHFIWHCCSCTGFVLFLCTSHLHLVLLPSLKCHPMPTLLHTTCPSLPLPHSHVPFPCTAHSHSAPSHLPLPATTLPHLLCGLTTAHRPAHCHRLPVHLLCTPLGPTPMPPFYLLRGGTFAHTPSSTVTEDLISPTMSCSMLLAAMALYSLARLHFLPM